MDNVLSCRYFLTCPVFSLKIGIQQNRGLKEVNKFVTKYRIIFIFFWMLMEVNVFLGRNLQDFCYQNRDA